ncbi:MAG: hypothetical protein U9Q04_10200 [Campylobacterota bacterium]|nr:hypothetical protein [Campylobacterota bacterium]
MNDITILTNAETIKNYSKEINFVKNSLLLEIQQTIKEAEFENGDLIEAFRGKFYETNIDSIMVLHKKIYKYKIDIESSVSIYKEALEIQDDIDTTTHQLSLLLQTTYDDVNALLHDIDSEVEYLRAKI